MPDAPELEITPPAGMSGATFTALVIGGCLAVALLVRQFADRLPIPGHLVEIVTDDYDEDQDDEQEQDA